MKIKNKIDYNSIQEHPFYKMVDKDNKIAREEELKITSSFYAKLYKLYPDFAGRRIGNIGNFETYTLGKISEDSLLKVLKDVSKFSEIKDIYYLERFVSDEAEKKRRRTLPIEKQVLLPAIPKVFDGWTVNFFINI